jgi:tetratricopeptide (TPR) repeat protein
MQPSTEFRRVAHALLIASLTVFFSLSHSACSTVQSSVGDLATSLGIMEHTQIAPIPKEAPEDYRVALQYLESGEFDQALTELDAFLQSNPTSPWTQAAILNSGRALEGLSRWSEAAARYRSVIVATEKAPKLQAMALYRLSFCLEALSDDTSEVAVLNDLISRQANLPPEIGNAEVPARLAAAYARVGNFDRAIEFYNQAEGGITKLRASTATKSGDPIPEWLPRTLYFMGNMSFRAVTFDDFEIAMRPLARGQIYLLQAAEFGREPWSTKSAEALMKIYSGLWTVIETAPLASSDDPVIAKRKQQRRQWQLSSLLLDAIVELQARALPKGSAGVSSQADQAMELVAEIEKKLGGLLQERPAGEGLTAEAAARSRGSFHVVSPDETLERKFLESGRDAVVPGPASGSDAAVPSSSPVPSAENAEASDAKLSKTLPPSLATPPTPKVEPAPQPATGTDSNPDAKPIRSNSDPNL